MIKKQLEHDFKANRLSSSYLVCTDDLDKSYAEVKDFVFSHLIDDNTDFNPDFLCIKKVDNKVKNISVDQIRVLQKFLYRTSVISGKRVAIIHSADQMNINAANSCLKILEDTPSDAFIFLITNFLGNIIPTIRSRCKIINSHYHVVINNENEEEYLKILDKRTQVDEMIKFLRKFEQKDRLLWEHFSLYLDGLLARFHLYSNKVTIPITVYEQEVFSQLSLNTNVDFTKKHNAVKQIIELTNSFDLDLKSNAMMLIEKFKE